jgi:hypothetical protein
MKKLPEYFQRFNKEILQKKVDFKKFDVKKTKEYFLQKHILKRVGILV